MINKYSIGFTGLFAMGSFIHQPRHRRLTATRRVQTRFFYITQPFYPLPPSFLYLTSLFAFRISLRSLSFETTAYLAYGRSVLPKLVRGEYMVVFSLRTFSPCFRMVVPSPEMFDTRLECWLSSLSKHKIVLSFMSALSKMHRGHNNGALLVFSKT